MQETKITVIGMSDTLPDFTKEQKERIADAQYFAGGKRHYERVESVLPKNANWHNISIPVSDLSKAIKKNGGHWVVFASGDPLFFGIANTLKREVIGVDMEVYSSFNSLQYLGQALLLNYGEYQTVTLTGRDWMNFDKALIHGTAKLALLTDRKKTPQAIAQRMLDAGFDNYNMQVGESLGGEKERIKSYSLQEASVHEFEVPNCLFLTQDEAVIIQKGIPESAFETLPGRPNMITKMPIRMATLSHMNLHKHAVLWDVGACSGSVSIESKLNYPHLQVFPFEIRPECERIIKNNKKTFNAIGIEPLIGDFLALDKVVLPCPDALFIGGYGGKLAEILTEANRYLKTKGIIAFNSVSVKSADGFLDWISKNEYVLEVDTCLTVDEHNSIRILIAKKQA